MRLKPWRSPASALALVLTTGCDVGSLSSPTSDALQLSIVPEPVVNVGASNEFFAFVSRADNSTPSATVAVSGVPSGVTVAVGAIDRSSPSIQRTTLTVTAEPSAPKGVFPINVTATAPASPTRLIQLTLKVQDPPPLTPIAFRWCYAGLGTTYMYQNDGGPWTPIVPDATGVLTFMATPRVTLGMTLLYAGFGNTGTFTSFYSMTSDELRQADCGLRPGSKKLYLRVVNGVRAGVSVRTALPDVADVLVIDEALGSGGERHRAMIARRDVSLPDGDTLPAFDLMGPEAARLDSTAFVHGFSECSMTFHTKSSSHEFFFGATNFLFSVPGQVLEASDIHEARCSNPGSGVRYFYRSPEGFDASAPQVTQIPTISHAFLPRASLNLEPSYPDMVGARFTHSSPLPSPGRPLSDITSISVWASRNFLGPDITKWILQTPVVVASTGETATLMKRPYYVETYFVSGPPQLFVGGKGSHGQVLRWAHSGGPTVDAAP